MLFTVYVRNSSGAPVPSVREAADRTALFAALEREGVRAIRVKEGVEPGLKTRSDATSAGGKSKPVVAWAVCCALVALVAALVWFLVASDDGSVRKSRENNKANRAQRASAKSTRGALPAKGTVAGSSRLGEVSATNRLALARDPAEVLRRLLAASNFVSTAGMKCRNEIFKHPSENHLCDLACLPVGTQILGDFEYDKEFMDDLKQSLKEKIEILPDDEEDIKFFKESVIALKEEIRGMFERGENVAKELAATRKQLQDLGVYKMQLELQMEDVRNEVGELNTKDSKDLVDAVNLMLKEKGIEPFEFHPLTGGIVTRMLFPSPEQAAEEEAMLQDQAAEAAENDLGKKP